MSFLDRSLKVLGWSFLWKKKACLLRGYSLLQVMLQLYEKGSISCGELGPREECGWGTQGKKHQTPHLKSLHGNSPFCLCASSAVVSTKASPRFERKRALKIMKCSCTLVRQVIWATHRNFHTHLIRGCFKITCLLFLNTMLRFRGIALAGNWGPLILGKKICSTITCPLSP